MNAVIVGFGMATALGADARTTWEGLIAGRSGVANIRRFDASTFPVKFAAETDLGAADGPDLYDALTDAVVDSALAGLDLGAVAPERRGVFTGCEAVRPDLTAVAEQLRTRAMPDLGDVARYHPARQSIRLASRIDARGPVTTLSIACTSSAQALGEALLAIRRGEVDVALAGGVDVLVHPLMVLGFSRLGALSQRNDAPAAASRPFDRARDGFVLGDGAGFLVLASPKVADRVGPALGRITGYASTCNAWRITDTPPDGRGSRVALVGALRDAGRRADEIAYINAHGTSTGQNDASEAAAIRAALGDAVWPTIPVSSTKSMIGHTVAACGAIEAIITLQAIRERVAPPTINLDDPDPDCALCHVANTARAIGPGIGVSNAAGFGGSNTAVVVETM